MNKKGTIIIPHNDSEAIAREAIKLLKNYYYRMKVGNEGRKSLDDFIIEKIIGILNDVLFSLYNGNISQLVKKQFYNETESYEILYEEFKSINLNEEKSYYSPITYEKIFDKNLIFVNNSFILPEERNQFFFG